MCTGSASYFSMKLKATLQNVCVAPAKISGNSVKVLQDGIIEDCFLQLKAFILEIIMLKIFSCTFLN